MARAEFRFYEELNDFLPPERRKRSFVADCARGATVKQAIEALGVPHTEVELILVNGASVDFGHRITEGDRVAVYPMFEALDVGPLVRVRERPLRRPRFIADAHLGALARRLRMLGFDTLYRNDLGDAEMARIAAEEGRVVLTRDRDLLMHRAITHGCYLRAERPAEQLREIMDRLDLYREARPFSRCMACNHPLGEPQAEPPPDVPDHARHHGAYRRCPGCRRTYWEGSHMRRMRTAVAALLAAEPRPP